MAEKDELKINLNQWNYYKQIERELELIMEQAFDLISIIDKNGMPIRVSKSCSKLFGVPQDEIVKTPVQDLEKKGILTKSVTVEVLREKKKISLIQDTRAGNRLMVTSTPIFDDSKEFVGVLNISQDITEVDRLNRQLEDTEHLLEWYRAEIRKKQNDENNMIVGKSPAMHKILETLDQIVSFEPIVLLTGETGVGKGVIAKHIHRMSKRRKGPFIQVNCGAIPENLLESELFGYEEGAFTGASKKGKKGLFETADRGTFFLDEIAEMPMNLQVKLLNVLQEREMYKLGGLTPIKVNARIISATNKDLKKLVKEGKFRADLFYRLNVMPIHIPPLRKRQEDIPVLVNQFLTRYNKSYGTNKTISSDVYQVMESYHWPGNIRELENSVERLIISCSGNKIDKEAILSILPPSEAMDNFSDAIIPLKQATEQVERELLRKALRTYKTTRKVGEVLGIDQSTVVKKLKRYQLQVD